MIVSWLFVFGSVFLTGISQMLLKIGAKEGERKNKLIAVYLNPYVAIAYGCFSWLQYFRYMPFERFL